MTLSKDTVAALVDLLENRLSTMCIGDCDDLRERITMQRALSELRGATPVGVLKDFAEIPRRGRRRKVSDILGERDDRH